MKNKKTDLDVDFIGGPESLTKEEEQAISAFIKTNKEKRKQQNLLKITNQRKTKQGV